MPRLLALLVGDGMPPNDAVGAFRSRKADFASLLYGNALYIIGAKQEGDIMADMLSRVETGRVFGDADADADGAEALPALHPLRFLGMGLLIAWLCCTHINTIYIDASSPARLPVETGMRLGDIGAFLAMAVLAPRIGALSGRRLAVSVSVLVTAFGTASIGLVLAPQGSEVAILVAAAAATKNPARQALVAMTGTFWSTVVICAITGIGIKYVDGKKPVKGQKAAAAASTEA